MSKSRPAAIVEVGTLNILERFLDYARCLALKFILGDKKLIVSHYTFPTTTLVPRVVNVTILWNVMNPWLSMSI